MAKILAFLALVNCVPQAVINPSNSTFFLDGVVYVRPDQMRDHILVHELYHDCQWQRAGRQGAKSWREWHYREWEAKRVELEYIEWSAVNPGEAAPRFFEPRSGTR